MRTLRTLRDTGARGLDVTKAPQLLREVKGVTGLPFLCYNGWVLNGPTMEPEITSHYEECAFEYVSQFDTPACDMELGNDDRRFSDDFKTVEWFDEQEQYDDYN